ncbi:MAG: hypothetical protein ACREJU_15310 [Nitrospiraceae bacterium]
MTCRQCHGPMTVDSFIDMQDDSGQVWLSAWRCVNCGQVLDPGIIRNKLKPRAEVVRLVERLRPGRRPSRTYVPVRMSA